MRLIPIQRGGVINEDIGPLPATADGVLAGTSSLYEAAGHAPPWICYVAVTNDGIVGTCGFKAAPSNGRVEIAYFTFPEFEGKGVATQMARQLVSIARDADSSVIVAAQTLPDRNASHRVLEKLGFTRIGTLEHPEDGTVLEWHKTDRVSPIRQIGATIIQPRHRASCHCGSVVLELDLPDGIVDARRCTCSMCRRKGAVMGAVPTAGLRVVQGAELLSIYRFNTMTAEHYFCSRCGIYTHHRRRSKPDQYGFNLGCLEGVDPNLVQGVPVNDGVNHPADRPAPSR